MTEDEIASILRERARLVARPAVAASQAEDVGFIEFELGEQRYAIEAAQAEEVIELADSTPVPGLPEFYVGILNWRGAVYPLVDIRRLLGFRVGRDEPFRFAILLAGSGRMVAVGVHAIVGLSRWQPDGIAPAAGQADESPAIAGLLANGTLLLDAGRIIHDARLLVDDQPRVAVTRGE